jgi:hypothetical protein
MDLSKFRPWNSQMYKLVQQVFINHDTDLMDVTLAVHPTSSPTKQQQVAVVSHGSHAPPVKREIVHTTQKHPWLTTNGWIIAGQLHLGNEVRLLDGATATVVGLKIIPGTASMYDLTVSNVHTFAVGVEQFIVPNTNRGCGVSANEVDSYGRLTYRQAGGDGLELHHAPADGVNNLFGIVKGNGGAIALPDIVHSGTRTFRSDAWAIIGTVRGRLAAGDPWNEVFRDELAADIRNLHELSVPNSQLRQLIAYWRNFAPYLMRK